MTVVRRLTVDGRRTAYREAGGGRPIVLVHGLGLSSRFWLEHFPVLADARMHVVAPDLPGFGESAGPAWGMSVDESADWLIAFADAVGLDRPAWLGHSLAAQAVIALAAERPERASALILASPTGAPVRLRRTRQVMGLLRDIAREPFELVPAVAREYLRTTPTAYVGTWFKAGDDRPLDRAHRVRCPTLLLLGRRDPLVPVTYLAALRRAMPRARVQRLPGSAHGMAFDRAGRIARRVATFLRKLD